MNAETRAPWSKDIRRQVLQLITLLVSLVVIGAGYDVWSHRAIELGRQKLTEYHLVSNSHYLHAMEELRKLQSHHALRAAAGGRWSSWPNTTANRRPRWTPFD